MMSDRTEQHSTEDLRDDVLGPADPTETETPIPAGAGKKRLFSLKGSPKKTTPAQVENPFARPIQRVEAEPDLDHAPILGEREKITGAEDFTPSLAQQLEAITNDLPSIATDTECLFLIGATGGAGVTTIARACSDRVIDTGTTKALEGAPVVVVAEVSLHSLHAAEELMINASRDGRKIKGLVMVHRRRAEDITQIVRSYAKRVARMYPQAFEVRYERTWPDALETKPRPSRFHRRRFTQLIRTLNAWAQPTPGTTDEETS